MDRSEKGSVKRQQYGNDMAVIKAYSIRLESDLSLLNQFYNGKKAWPDEILKIRQTIYKKRHAKVLSEKKKKLSQGDLGQLVGIGQAQISRWERGLAKPTDDLIKKLRQILLGSVVVLSGPWPLPTFRRHRLIDHHGPGRTPEHWEGR